VTTLSASFTNPTAPYHSHMVAAADDYWSTSRSGRFTPAKKTRYHCIGGWVGLGAGLDGCGNLATSVARTPDYQIRSLVTILTTGAVFNSC